MGFFTLLVLGINILVVCSAFEDPAFNEDDLLFDEAEEDQFTALREELEADLQDMLDERLEEVRSELTALRGQLEALQAVYTSLPQGRSSEAEQDEESPAEAEQDEESPAEAKQDEESLAEAKQDEESPDEDDTEQYEESPDEDDTEQDEGDDDDDEKDDEDDEDDE